MDAILFVVAGMIAIVIAVCLCLAIWLTWTLCLDSKTMRNFRRSRKDITPSVSEQQALQIAREKYEMVYRQSNWEEQETRTFENDAYWVVIIGAQYHHPTYSISIDIQTGEILRHSPGGPK